MKVLIQRVKKASVTIENELFSSINKGILAFVGIEKESAEKEEKITSNFVCKKRKNIAMLIKI